MSRPAWHRGGGSRMAEAALWTGAVVIVLTVHVGAPGWLMRDRPIAAADDAPPAEIMIDLAPEPEAIETEISEQMQDAEERAPAKDVAAPEEPEPIEDVAEEVSDPEPVPEPVEDKVVEEEDPLEETVALLPDAAVPLPRPTPPAPKRVVTKKPKKQPVQKAQKPRPQKQQAASQTTHKAQVQAKQSNRNAARQTSSGVSQAEQARWKSRLMAHLERRKRYRADARRRSEQGIVYVRLRIDDNGNVRSASIAGSSGHAALDNEVLSLVRRASPVPKRPPGVNKTITAPFRFSRR
ncbi:MAG: energy transducer TonB [Rhizobiaceae bacterium]|nr:energy transducer TonB [Rhizobiaceae bacterium]